MMTKINFLIVIHLFCSFNSIAQKHTKSDKIIFPEVNGQVVYSGIDSASGSKEELFQRAKVWFVNNYKSANDVLQMADKEEGVIIGKGTLGAGYSLGMLGVKNVAVSHSIKVEVKEGKFKYEIIVGDGQFISPYTSGAAIINIPVGNYDQNTNKKNYRKFLEETHLNFELWVSSLKKGLHTKTDKNW